MSDPLHVLFLPSGYPSAESPVRGIYNQEQAKALYRAGVQVGVAYAETRYWRRMTPAAICRDWQREGLHREDGVLTYRLYRWHFARLLQRSIVAATTTAARRYFLKAGRPDVIHVHSADYAGLAARQLFMRYGIPYVITEHSSAFQRGFYSTSDLVEIRTVYEGAAQVITVSRRAAQVLVDAALVSIDSAIVIPNAVDTDYFIPQSKESTSAPFRFLTVALMSPVKRMDWMLRAFAQASAKSEDVVLEIGGDGKQRPALEQLASELGISEKVVFLGRLDREGVRDAMNRANAFLLSSQFETFGVVLIEALASGVPVIATACGGPEDIVSPEVGMLVPVNDFDAFVAAMRKMRASAHHYNPTVLHAYAVRHYSSSAVAARLIEIYRYVRNEGGSSIILNHSL